MTKWLRGRIAALRGARPLVVLSVLSRRLCSGRLALHPARSFIHGFHYCHKGVNRGFTLIELMVVMVIIALLLTLAVPRYFKSVDRAREATLVQNLGTVRDAIDKYYGDNDRYPLTLEELVEKQYLKAVPQDPITEQADTWVIVPPANGGAGVYDIKSGAPGSGRNGKPFAEW